MYLAPQEFIDRKFKERIRQLEHRFSILQSMGYTKEDARKMMILYLLENISIYIDGVDR